MTEDQSVIFSNGQTVSPALSETSLFTPDTMDVLLHRPSTAFLLNRENALAGSGALVEGIMLQLSMVNQLGNIKSWTAKPAEKPFITDI